MKKTSKSNESLTKSEQQYINHIFDFAVDTKSLTKAFNKNASKKAYAEYCAEDDKITFFDKDFDINDFIDEGSIFQFATFIHEVTHAWQFQNGHINEDLDNEEYEYTLLENSKFEDFGIEQQATIVEDYAATFLHPSEITDNHSQQNKDWNPDSLKKVVEDQFPNIKEARVAIEEVDKEFQIRYKVAPLTV